MTERRTLAETLKASREAVEARARNGAATAGPPGGKPKDEKKITAPVRWEVYRAVAHHVLESRRPIGALLAALVDYWLAHPEIDQEVYGLADRHTVRYRRGGGPQQPAGEPPAPASAR